MPRNPSPNVPAPVSTAQTGLASLPDDVRADLLRAQTEQVTTFQRLPRIKIMAAGAGRFEFMDDNSIEATFRGIILNSHPRNILWDRPFGEDRPQNQRDEDSSPACSSPDGKFGTPRVGFQHVELGGRPATGTERIECSSCRYNQWNSIGLINPARSTAKGKATTNQRSLYVLIEDRTHPYELILPPTSLTNYDAYLIALAGRHVPVQAVLTEFSQEVKNSAGGLRWGVAKFAEAGLLDGETFQYAMAKRREYQRHITPSEYAVNPAVEAELAGDGASGVAPEDDDAPF